jgi:formylglycine-generating enzyme required for sulfatase activity
MRTLLIVALVLPSASRQEEREKLLKTFHDEFVSIEPATFTMGSTTGLKAEQPPHEVKIAAPFKIARYEVPQNLWEAVMGSNPSRWKGRRNSVEMLSYEEAEEFCRKGTELLRSEGLIGKEAFLRLPSEAEWEFCARAGTRTAYSFGDDAKDLNDYAWHTGNAAGNDPPVGAKKPNPWKLYDMHGYLWEWCLDVWHDSYEGAPTNSGAWSTGGDPKRRVLRGGSWKDQADALTSSYRRGAPIELKDDAVGLRCVLATTESKPR